MPTLQQGGVMSRVTVRALTIAAAATVLLCATSVRAVNIPLFVDPTQSSLKIDLILNYPPFGVVNEPSAPQVPGGDIATYSGNITISRVGNTIQLLPGSAVTANIMGNYAPKDLGPGNDPTGPPLTPANKSPANYGLMISPALPLIPAVQLNSLVMDFGSALLAIPSTPMNLASNNFNLAGQAMQYTSGRTVGVVAIAGNNFEDSIVGLPTLFGTTGADIGTWDGYKLVLPVHSVVQYPFGDGTVTQFLTGQIVAVIPEPSTMIMAGLGVVGLVGVGLRARRRKA